MLMRTALLDRIGRSPLTVVRAPGGSGKTVLMAQWASERPERGAWVTVEPDIGTRGAFWNAVLDGAPGLESRPDWDDGGDPEARRRELLRAFRGLDEAFVLVVDDAHELRDPVVVEDLLAVLRACPHVQLVVGTRSRSELEAPRQALTLDIAVIGPDEMVLSAEDVETLVGAEGSRHGTTAELLEASGGNPLLLRAILAGSPAGGRPRSSARATMHDHLRHLFASRGAEFAAFASATSVPDDLDVVLAGHLSGVPRDGVETFLTLLETEGLVMRRDVAGSTRYRYHPLVREALRDALKHDHQEQYRHASLLASAAAEARGQFLPALRHAVDAEDYTRASDVCLHGGFTLLRSRGAAAILQRVPFRYVARLPFLAIVLGLAANARGERLKALELLTLALGASRAWRGRQRVAERAGLALVESVVLRITGRADESAGAARRMLALLDEAAPVDLEEIAAQESAYRYQGALSLFRAGRLSEARLAADRIGLSAPSLRNGAPEVLGAASLVATVDAARGDGAAAARTLADIDSSDIAAELRDGYVGSLAHLARGILALEQGDPDAAERHIEAFRDRVNIEHGTLFAVVRALAALWRGTPDVGLRILDARDGADGPRARQSEQDKRLAGGTRVLLFAALGQIGSAYEALRDLERSGAAATILHAALLLVEQRPDLVVERLGGRADDAGPRLQAAGELLMATASLQRGDRDVAAAALRRFLATSAVHDVVSPVVLVPGDLRPALWELAEELGVDPARLDRLRAMPAPFRPAPARATLTRREVDVLEQLRSTSSQADIAATLNVSPNTVKSQLRTLYRKLGVATREEALRVVYLQGLLAPPASRDAEINPRVKSEG